MGGDGQPGIKKKQAIQNAVDLQEELALNWNYNIVIPNAIAARNQAELHNINNPTLAYINSGAINIRIFL